MCGAAPRRTSVVYHRHVRPRRGSCAASPRSVAGAEPRRWHAFTRPAAGLRWCALARTSDLPAQVDDKLVVEAAEGAAAAARPATLHAEVGLEQRLRLARRLRRKWGLVGVGEVVVVSEQRAAGRLLAAGRVLHGGARLSSRSISCQKCSRGGGGGRRHSSPGWPTAARRPPSRSN